MDNKFVVSMLFKAVADSSVFSTFSALRNNIQGLSDEERKLEGQSNRYKSALTKLYGACRQNTGAHKGFERAIGKVEKRLHTARKAMSDYHKETNRQKRSDLQGDMMGVANIAMTAATPIMAAVHFESSMANVRSTVDFKDESEFKQMGLDLQNMSERIPMAISGLADIAATAGQAGISASELPEFIEDAAKMGVAFDMSGTEAGGVMLGLRSIFKLNQDEAVSLGNAVNHLSNNMDTTSSSMLNVMNQTGSSGKMIGLTGQQVAALGSTFLALKTSPEAAGTAMNTMFTKLATADKQGKKFQSALQAIGMDAQGLKAAMKDDAQGAILTFLEAIDGAEDKTGIITALFDAKDSDKITKLVGGLDKYKKALGLVADKTNYAGSMQKEYDIRSKTTASKLQLMKNKMTNAGIAIGSLLLPALSVAAEMLGSVAGAIRYVAEEFPLLTKSVGMIAGLLIGFKVAALASGYAATFLSDGLNTAKTVFTFLRPSILKTNIALGWNRAVMLKNSIASNLAALNLSRFGIVQKTVALGGKIWAGVMWAVNAAMTANPIGLIVAGVAALVGFVYRLITSWDKLVSAWKNSSGILSGIGNVVSTFFGFGDDEEEEKEEQETEKKIHKKVGVVQESLDESPRVSPEKNTRLAGPVIPVLTDAATGVTATALDKFLSDDHRGVVEKDNRPEYKGYRERKTEKESFFREESSYNQTKTSTEMAKGNNTYHFNITQQPGQSAKELAREVAAILQRQNNGALHDGI
ncbi:phage tail tape measure protein [Maridesulfovibrio hydrothermalis]|uniref:Phage tail tape measure protein domain-containing protein n=1 Tax=Maridesulfovibrio hydrothermalis AM13 = DSM 14728 TaxID=1121451 RepID=L0R7N5_9BACT|nr:phage tail tape measure protein [Maridesulfovibrio hydrothermalis]CCO22232.1 membrane protein of unknown function [Maridesulfovibrio hydrothermalis AM13 = DSM 14728]